MPDLSTVVVWCFPHQRLSRELWVACVWSPLFSCPPALLLVPARLSREIQGILAVAGWLVVAVHAIRRPRFLTHPHRTGGLTSDPANSLLSMCGRLEVVQSGVRTFKQEMWRAWGVLWRCAASDLCGRKPIFSAFPSLRNMLELKSVQCSSCPTLTLAGTPAL